MARWVLALVPMMMTTAAIAQAAVPHAAEYEDVAKQCDQGKEKACQKLLRVAVEDSQGERGVGAGSWLVDPRHLAVMASTAASPAVRGMAVERLGDQALLSRIAREDPSDYVRRTAAMRVTDPAVLRDLALHDEDEFARFLATQRLTDQDVLRTIVQSDAATKIRTAAIERLEDQDLLVAVATADRDTEAAARAASRVNDPAWRAEIARRSRHGEARRRAVARLTDTKVLAEIARTDTDERVRREAVEHLGKDPAALVEAAKNDPAESVRLAVLNTLDYDRLDDRSLYVHLAQHDSSESVRARAVGLVQDRDVLARIARQDASPSVRAHAVQTMDDVMVLAEVWKNDVDPDVRRVALAKLAAPPKLPAALASDRALTEAVKRHRKAQARLYREYKPFLILEGGYGSPTGAFAAVGIRIVEDRSNLEEGAGGVLAAEIGKDASRLRLGYVFPPGPVGVGINAVAVRGGESLGRETYLGGELDLSLMGRPLDILHGRVGVMTRARDFGKDTTVTWGVSVNIPAVALLVLLLNMPCIACT